MNATRVPSKSGLSTLDDVRAEKIRAFHRERLAVVYVRQSTVQQVLDHQESTRLQYGLVSRAQALGWAADRVLVIDEDLGKSGTSAQGRTGFQRLVSEVSLDHVGIIFGVEMSRLARSNKDWHQLLELCALFHTLIADLDGIYDPVQYNDRLLLGLKGTMSEAELHILKQRMHQGRLSKAGRGELQFALPVGYVWSPTGEIQFDPDEQVQQVVRLVFRTFEDLGTLGGLVRYLAHHQIQLGVRVREGPGKGELVWRRPNRATLQMMLKHPLYAGSYVYGRRQDDPRRKQPQRPRTGRVVMPMDEWLVLLPNHCPAYISPEQYEHNQVRLQANRARADAMGAARNGSALLAGLVVCARCGCRLSVHYDDGGSRLHTYECVERWTHYGEPRCQHLAGPCLDAFVRKPGAPRPGASRLRVVAERHRASGAGAGRVGSALATTTRTSRLRSGAGSPSVPGGRTGASAGGPDTGTGEGARNWQLSSRWRRSITALSSTSHACFRKASERRFVAWRRTFPLSGPPQPPQQLIAKRSSARWLNGSSWTYRAAASASRCVSSGSAEAPPRVWSFDRLGS